MMVREREAISALMWSWHRGRDDLKMKWWSRFVVSCGVQIFLRGGE